MPINIKGAFVWDQSGIRIIGIMRVSVCLRALLIPEYLDFHSGYSAPGPRSRIARIYSGIYSYSGISQTNAPLDSYDKVRSKATKRQRNVLKMWTARAANFNQPIISLPQIPDGSGWFKTRSV